MPINYVNYEIRNKDTNEEWEPCTHLTLETKMMLEERGVIVVRKEYEDGDWNEWRKT